MATIVGTMATSVPLKWIVFDEANFEKQDSIQWHIKLLKLNKISGSQLINVSVASVLMALSLAGTITDKGIPINEYCIKQKLSMPCTKFFSLNLNF